MLVKVCKFDEVKPGKAKSVQVEGRSIAIFNVKGNLFAVDDSCSHMGAPLSGGMLAGKSITCEWHGACFDLESGDGLEGPHRGGVAAYKVTVNGDDLEIDL